MRQGARCLLHAPAASFAVQNVLKETIIPNSLLRFASPDSSFPQVLPPQTAAIPVRIQSLPMAIATISQVFPDLQNQNHRKNVSSWTITQAMTVFASLSCLSRQL